MERPDETFKPGPQFLKMGRERDIVGIVNEHVHEGMACVSCGYDYEFTLPKDLVEICHRGNLVIFAGAGISTEVPAVFPQTLYDEIRIDLDLEGGSFPEVMQSYQDAHGRADLVGRVKKKFEYVDSFPTPRRAARKFHREISTIPFVRDIITTNWDTHFEEECLASPFIQGDDFALLELYDRRVYKLHGSISNLSSLVITESDYLESLSSLGQNVLGAHVKQLLATKTIVFVGYSLSDWNFQRIYETLRSDMGKFAPKAYFVSPFASDAVEKYHLKFLQTSGVKFAKELKAALGNDCVIPDEKFDEVAQYQSELVNADAIAKSVPFSKFPAVLFCWNYHDGAMDACFRILQRSGSGEYSNKHRVLDLARRYSAAADRAYDGGRFTDAAYLEGYTEALVLLLSIDEDDAPGSIPYFFLYGSESPMRSLEDFKLDLEGSRRRAPKERMFARKALKDLPPDMVLEHSRILPDLVD